MGGDGTYVVPLRLERGDAVEELAAYLQSLTGHVEVVVVDGSPPAVWQRNHPAFGDGLRPLRVDPRFACPPPHVHPRRDPREGRRGRRRCAVRPGRAAPDLRPARRGRPRPPPELLRSPPV